MFSDYWFIMFLSDTFKPDSTKYSIRYTHPTVG